MINVQRLNVVGVDLEVGKCLRGKVFDFVELFFRIESGLSVSGNEQSLGQKKEPIPGTFFSSLVSATFNKICSLARNLWEKWVESFRLGLSE